MTGAGGRLRAGIPALPLRSLPQQTGYSANFATPCESLRRGEGRRCLGLELGVLGQVRYALIKGEANSVLAVQ